MSPLTRRAALTTSSLLAAGAALQACGQAESSSGTTLLAFFSRPGENYSYGDREWIDIGHTERVAGFISAELGCDTYRIEAAAPYPEAYDPTVARN